MWKNEMQDWGKLIIFEETLNWLKFNVVLMSILARMKQKMHKIKESKHKIEVSL
jgi:hypothetical protein